MKKSILILVTAFTFLILFILANPVETHAVSEWERENLSGEGVWYDHYKHIFENNNPIGYHAGMYDGYEDYNFITKEYDCGGGWIRDTGCNIKNLFTPAYHKAVMFPVNMIRDVVSDTSSVQEHPVILSYKNAISGLGVTLLAIFLSFHMVKIVAMRMADPEDMGGTVNEKTSKIIVGAILLGLYTQFMDWFFLISNTASDSVLSENMMRPSEHLARMVSMSDGGIMAVLLLTIIMLIFWIAFLYRIAIAGLLFAVGPVAITTIANDTFNYFDLWLKQLVNNAVTIVLQAMCFAIGTVMVTGGSGAGFDYMLGFTFYVLAIMIPSILGQLGSSSGTTRSLATIARTMAMRR